MFRDAYGELTSVGDTVRRTAAYGDVGCYKVTDVYVHGGKPQVVLRAIVTLKSITVPGDTCVRIA